jgi:hypothetical protein
MAFDHARKTIFQKWDWSCSYRRDKLPQNTTFSITLGQGCTHPGGLKSPGQLNFAQCRLIFLCHRCGTCFLSPFWCLKFCGNFQIPRKFLERCTQAFRGLKNIVITACNMTWQTHLCYIYFFQNQLMHSF